MKKLKLLAVLLLILMALILPVCTAIAEAGDARRAEAVIDFTDIVRAVFALLASLITYKLIPWIKSRTTVNQQTLLQASIKTAVYAAEQLYGAGHGDLKLDYALKWLGDKGYNIEKDAIRAGVEAAVKALTLNQSMAIGIPIVDDAAVPSALQEASND